MVILVSVTSVIIGVAVGVVHGIPCIERVPDRIGVWADGGLAFQALHIAYGSNRRARAYQQSKNAR